MKQLDNPQQARSVWLIVGRLLIAVVFAVGACYNFLVTLRAPVIELGRLIDLSPLAFVRELARSIALPHATIFVIGVLLFEASVAVSVLLRVAVRRRAYAASLAFFLMLAPLIGWYALSNLIWALPASVLLHYDRPKLDTGAA